MGRRNRIARAQAMRLCRDALLARPKLPDWPVRCVAEAMAPTVADIMNRKLLYIREGDRLSLARGKLLEFGVTAIPVLDDEHKPVAIVSLRDLDHADERLPANGPVRVVRGAAVGLPVAHSQPFDRY